MRKLALLMVVVAVGLLLSLPPAARADFALTYPDGVVAYAINFGPGLNVVAMINDFGDIFTMHSDGFSNPVTRLPGGASRLTRDVAVLPQRHSGRTLRVRAVG